MFFFTGNQIDESWLLAQHAEDDQSSVVSSEAPPVRVPIWYSSACTQGFPFPYPSHVLFAYLCEM